MEESCADVTPDVAVAAPLIVWCHGYLADSLCVRVVHIYLYPLVDGLIYDLYKLIDVMEDGLRGPQEEVLEWHKASVCCWRIREDLQHPDAMIFSWIHNIVSDRRTKEPSTRPLPRVYNNLPRGMRSGIEDL